MYLTRKPILSNYLCILAVVFPTAGLCQDRPFTQRDSIEMTRVTNVEGRLVSRPGLQFALFSPDGERFVVRTLRGDIERDENVEQILLFETGAIQRGLSSRGNVPAMPRPRVVAELRFHEDQGQASRLQWIDNRTLGYISKPADQPPQAFALDILTGETRQLTHAPGEVVSFAIAGDRVIYYSGRPPASSDVTVIPSRGRSYGQVGFNYSANDYVIDLYSRSLTSGEVSRINAPPGSWLLNQLWISPDGNRAIIRRAATDAAAHWARYRTVSPSRAWTANWVRSDPLSPDLSARQRFFTLDLRSGQIRPLFDAPDGQLGSRLTPSAFWLDDRRVVIVNSYLPLETPGLSNSELALRMRMPAIAEVDVETGFSRPIIWLDFDTEEDQSHGRFGEQYRLATWDGAARTLSLTKVGRHAEAGREIWARSSAGAWSQVSPEALENALPAIERRESTTERPMLYASGGACQCGRLLFDAAPEADSFTFGRQEVFRWTDNAGRAWSGGLIYPIGYQPGRRYPLVLQTHGYYEGEFQIDGYHNATTAYAAQALANQGFVVLQDAPPSVGQGMDEIERFLDGYTSAIAALDRQGLIDPHRVGIIGFSRTGLYVAHLLGRYPNLVQAATISDSAQYNYLHYLILAEAESRRLGDDLRSMTGGLPHEMGIANWFAGNRIYDIARSNAAIRFESITGGTIGLAGNWETFAFYRYAGGPAEFILYPHGSHILMKPSERLASQGGTVDWYRFWLKGEQDPDPAKAEQYAYWRRLRDERDARAQRLRAEPPRPTQAPANGMP